jgi:RNA polymerase sigma factor (sigma-70 family)
MCVTDQAENAFELLYHAHYADLLRYTLRRVDQPADAADVLAETWIVAWRRRHELPKGGEQRLWLFGVARKVLANQRRGRVRHQRLADKLRSELSDRPGWQPDDHPVTRALHSLSPADQDLLAMQAWEGLSAEEMAAVLGCKAGAARVRLHRARGRLREALISQGFSQELDDEAMPSMAKEIR